MPEPDVAVLRGDAVPVREIGSRILQWSPDDVLLVVEVSDSTLRRDLEEQSLVYAAAALTTYWVVVPDAVHVLTEPGPDGYGHRETYRRGDQVPVSYAPGVSLAVDDILR